MFCDYINGGSKNKPHWLLCETHNLRIDSSYRIEINTLHSAFIYDEKTRNKILSEMNNIKKNKNNIYEFLRVELINEKFGETTISNIANARRFNAQVNLDTLDSDYKGYFECHFKITSRMRSGVFNFNKLEFIDGDKFDISTHRCRRLSLDEILV